MHEIPLPPILLIKTVQGNSFGWAGIPPIILNLDSILWSSLLLPRVHLPRITEANPSKSKIRNHFFANCIELWLFKLLNNILFFGVNADSDLRTGIRSSSGQKKRKKFVPAIRAIWRKQVKLSSRTSLFRGQWISCIWLTLACLCFWSLRVAAWAYRSLRRAQDWT